MDICHGIPSFVCCVLLRYYYLPVRSVTESAGWRSEFYLPVSFISFKVERLYRQHRFDAVMLKYPIGMCQIVDLCTTVTMYG